MVNAHAVKQTDTHGQTNARTDGQMDGLAHRLTDRLTQFLFFFLSFCFSPNAATGPKNGIAKKMKTFQQGKKVFRVVVGVAEPSHRLAPAPAAGCQFAVFCYRRPTACLFSLNFFPPSFLFFSSLSFLSLPLFLFKTNQPAAQTHRLADTLVVFFALPSFPSSSLLSCSILMLCSTNAVLATKIGFQIGEVLLFVLLFSLFHLALFLFLFLFPFLFWHFYLRERKNRSILNPTKYVNNST